MQGEDEPTRVGSTRGEENAANAVLERRFELCHRLFVDAFSHGYYARDHVEECDVMVRTLRSDLMQPSVVHNVLARLEHCAQFAGHALAGVTHVGMHDVGFVVEPLPAGVSLREVIEERRKTPQKNLNAAELLPVIAHVHAGLTAMEDGVCHGDLRPSHCWMTEERGSLSGAFLFSALPAEVRNVVLKQDASLRRRFAPECARGAVTGAADRYAAAVICHEALVGVVPAHGAGPDQRIGAMSRMFAAYLDSDPTRRPETLLPLIESLAHQAALPVPDVPVLGTRRGRRTYPNYVPVGDSSNTPLGSAKDDEVAGDTTLMAASALEHLQADSSEVLLANEASDDDAATRPRIEVGGHLDATPAVPVGRTKPVASVFSEPTPPIAKDDLVAAAAYRPNRGPLVDASDDIDPRLVRAALGVEMQPESPDSEPPPQAQFGTPQRPPVTHRRMNDATATIDAVALRAQTRPQNSSRWLILLAMFIALMMIGGTIVALAYWQGLFDIPLGR